MFVSEVPYSVPVHACVRGPFIVSLGIGEKLSLVTPITWLYGGSCQLCPAWALSNFHITPAMFHADR